MSGILIESVHTGSPAYRAGLLPGQLLTEINGNRLRDLIDYLWHSGDEELKLTIRDTGGNILHILVEIEHGESLGLTFPATVPRRCSNNCIFCFIHQLPKGLRRPLYIKDEDYRLSFLHGTYITMTNLKSTDLRRIVMQRLSPLYISVHAVNPELREMLLGRTGIPPVLQQLKKLVAAGIELHTQVVLCPGINDGTALEETVEELASLYPAVRSLAVVPVGLTRHRQNLPYLAPVDKGYAVTFLAEWMPRMRSLNKRLGGAFLQLADEFYLKAEMPFPHLKEYGELPQWENGVGMAAWFAKEASAVLKRAKPLAHLNAKVVTGKSSFGFVTGFLDSLSEKTGCNLKAFAVTNRLFGETVTVTGLISCKDIIEQFKPEDNVDVLLIPDVMLKEDEGCFIDDRTLGDLNKVLDIPVVSFESSPTEFYKVIRRLGLNHTAKPGQTGSRAGKLVSV